MKIKLSENLCRPEDTQCLKETDETLYCIVAKTVDGKTKFYKDGAFIDDYTNCTTFNDLDEARAEWFDIDKSKYRRVFVPIYDPEAFEQHLTESKEATRDIILEIVQGEFETGHNIADSKEEFFKIMKDEGIRPSTRMWDFYNECHNLGPAGFYDEYKDVLDFDPMFVSEYGAEELDEGLKDARSNRQKLKAYFAAQGKTLNVEENLKKYETEREQELGYKTCDNCGTRLNDGGTCPKCDDGEEDMNESLYQADVDYIAKETSYEIAKKIAETAKRALKLPAHEVEMLEHDINNLRANEWVDTFAKLSDRSEAKKLFFKYAVEVADEMNESYSKVDEDTANEIALMAMRAMRLKEHEAEALEHDLIEGNADKWIKDFEALSDDSDVKKLFFTYAVKADEELTESEDSETCCICKEPIKGYGNNAEPVCSGRCCDKCNMDVVLPARVKALRDSKNEALELDDIHGNVLAYLEEHPYPQTMDAEDICEEVCDNLFNEDYHTMDSEKSYEVFRAVTEYLGDGTALDDDIDDYYVNF